MFRRLYGDYVWFWPGNRPIEADPSWTKTTPESKKTVAFSFAPARLDPAIGLISPALDDGNGWVLKVDAHDDGAKIPALPDRCPSCDSEGWNPGDKYFSGTVRSPIRAHTSGAAQSTQLYLSQLVRSMGETPVESRTIVFTDSRDDAARTAAGVGLNHYRDVIRQVTQQILARDRWTSVTLSPGPLAWSLSTRPSSWSSRTSSCAIQRRRNCRRKPRSCARPGRAVGRRRSAADSQGELARPVGRAASGAHRPAGFSRHPPSGLRSLGGQEPG